MHRFFAGRGRAQDRRDRRVRTECSLFYLRIRVVACVMTKENKDQRWVIDTEPQLTIANMGRGDHRRVWRSPACGAVALVPSGPCSLHVPSWTFRRPIAARGRIVRPSLLPTAGAGLFAPLSTLRVHARRLFVPESLRSAPRSGPRTSPRVARVVEIGHRHARQSLADRLLDRAQIVLFFRSDERERVAVRLRARGTADAVDVVLRHVRHVEVHDVAERLDVDAARGDVGRDEHPVLRRS